MTSQTSSETRTRLDVAFRMRGRRRRVVCGFQMTSQTSSETRTRLDVAFPSSGDECRAWLFLPDAERPPLVILGHGLGATREYGLEPFARRFADAGIAALVFTYRHFGDSGGQPRQLLDIERQLGDWAAALAYARSLDGIDRDRIALWGTS